jgi:hypothetical protein
MYTVYASSYVRQHVHIYVYVCEKETKKGAGVGKVWAKCLLDMHDQEKEEGEKMWMRPKKPLKRTRKSSSFEWENVSTENRRGLLEKRNEQTCSKMCVHNEHLL